MDIEETLVRARGGDKPRAKRTPKKKTTRKRVSTTLRRAAGPKLRGTIKAYKRNKPLLAAAATRTGGKILSSGIAKAAGGAAFGGGIVIAHKILRKKDSPTINIKVDTKRRRS